MQSQIIKYKNSKKNISNKLCLAPFTSLRFTVLGNIQVCCFNRLFTLGKYPAVSISEAWFGEKNKVLKESIDNNDLSLGCGYCNDSIKNNLFKSVGANNYDYLENNNDNNMPTMLDFELGNNCNLECIMCNGENSALIRKNREHQLPYSPPYDNNFLKQLDEFIPFLKEARFVGGEPFLIELNFQVWEKIIEKNPHCQITILTNGTILNSKIKDLLNKGNFSISVSTDGISKSTYEKIRKNANFEEFNSNLSYFLDYSKKKNSPFFLNFCPMVHNWHEIPDMFNFCNKNNIHLVIHTVLFPPDSAIWILPEKQLIEIKNNLVNSKPNFLSFKKSIKSNKYNYESIINQIDNWINISNNTALLNYSESELKEKFYNKVLQYINNSNIFTENIKSYTYTEYISKFEEILNSISNQNIFKILIFLNSFSVELIIAELANSTTEKVRDRLNYGIK